MEGFELLRLAMPLVEPFRSSNGVESERDVLLVRALTDGGDGWGECVALREPIYSPEYVDGAHDVIRRHLAPRLLGGALDAADVARRLAPVRGHPMAKAALEMAVLDAQLRAEGRSLAQHLGATRRRVPCGVSVGLFDTTDALVAAVGRYVEAGYARVKLKIAPGRDVEVVAAVRAAYGTQLPLQVDANGSYSAADIDALRALDPFGLVLIEQPFPEDDLAGHAALARQISTPVCLDESVTSVASAIAAIDAGAASIINIKPGRVGGLLAAAAIHDACVERGVAVWCGGMLETGIGRAANLALAALPGFTLPGDISASDRYFERDITEPFVLEGGEMAVPDGPGIGVAPRPEELRRALVARELVDRGTLG